MHCVSERYAFLPYRLRQEKQRGKGHHARRKDTAEGSGFLPEIRRGIRHDFPQRGRSPAAVSENRKTGNHQLDNLCKWIEQTRQEMKKRSMEERGELMDEDYRLCPEALPEGMIDYIRRDVLPEDRVIIYKKGNVHGTCSVCGRKVHARGRRFVQGTRVNCPNCGTGVSCVLENGSVFASNYIEKYRCGAEGNGWRNGVLPAMALASG